jgi:hypothetical protein
MIHRSNSRMAALEVILNNSPQIDLPLIERSLNALIEEEWECLDLIKDTCPPELLKYKKKVVYQYELLLLAVSKSNRS